MSFNTDVGMEGEQDVMLQRIWGSGSQKLEQLRRLRNSRRSREYESQFKLRIHSLKEDEDERDEALEEACISRPTTARSLKSLRASYRTVPKTRPHTAMERLNGYEEAANKKKDEKEVDKETDKYRKHKQEVTMSTPIIRVVIENECGDKVQGGSGGEQTMMNRLDSCEISGKEDNVIPDKLEEKVFKENEAVFKVTDMNNDSNVHAETKTNDPAITEPKGLTLPLNPDENETAASTLKEVGQNNEVKNDKESCKLEISEAHPKTVGGHMSPFFSPTSNTGTRLHSRKVSISHRPNQHNHVKIGSLFPEDKKPSLLELQKVQVRLANYEGRIKKFGDSLDDIRYKENADNSVDYYNIRLQASTDAEQQRKKQNLRKTYEDLVTTTEGEYRRWKGNPEIRSMTTRTVDWDFKNRRSSYIDVSMY